MHYLKSVNAFYNNLNFTSLSPKAINLWHALAHSQGQIFGNTNSYSVSPKFKVSTNLILQKTSLSRPSIKLAYKELVNKNLLNIYADKNLGNIYQLNTQFESIT